MNLGYFSALCKPLAFWRVALAQAVVPLIVCLTVALTGPSVQARSILDLDAARQPIALGDWGEYWIDNGKQRGPDEVNASSAITWQPTHAQGIYPLESGQTLWVRFTVPPAPDAERWLLEIPYPALDRASLYTKDRTGQFTEQRSGDATAVNRWSTPHRYPLQVVAFNAEEPTHYLLRLENAQGFSAPIRFVDARYALRSEQQTSLFLGFYFGMAALGALLGLIGWALVRDRAYLYYAACSALVGLTLAAVTGVAGLHLWPNSPNWADRSLAVLASGAFVSFILLNATVVSLAERSKRLNALVWAVALLGVTGAVLLGITDSAWRLKLVVPNLLLMLTVVFSINLWAWRHGDRYAGWLLLTAAPFVLTWILATARYLGWLPLSFATEQGGLASMALLLPALLAVLVLRSQQHRQNRSRILGLDRIDPTTGLINEVVFAQRLLRMSARSERLKHHSAVLMIEVINTEQTQRDYGRKVADEIPLRVASRLLSIVRDIDSAARLTDKRFGMLIEGPISAREAETMGPRVVARCLMPFKGLHVECVAQVRVAYALVPYQSSSGKSLLTKLEERLSTASNTDDKRAVFFVSSANGGKSSSYVPI